MEDNAVYDNSAGRSADDANAKETSRLPVQLSRLPVDKLEKIQKALAELEAAGLSEVTNIAELQRVVGEKTCGSNARIPPEDLTSEYQGMNLWAWTPKRWFESTNKEVVAAGAKSGTEVQAGNEEVPELVASGEPSKRAATSMENECFKTWWEKMKQAEAEILSWKDLDSCASLPTQAGDGPGCLFQQQSSAGEASGPRELPKAVKYPRPEGKPTMVARTRGRATTPLSVLTLHFGETGCSTGHAAWERIMAEHCLGADGRPKDGSFYGRSCVHFAESVTGRYVPQAIFAGYGSLDAVSAAGMFDPNTILQKTSPGSRWQDGYGHDSLVEEVLDRVRLQCEKGACSDMILTYSLFEDGPTSGFAAKFLQRASVEYGKASKFCIAGTPDCMDLEGNQPPTSWGYCGLSYNTLMEHTDVCSFFDRTSLAKLASSKINGLGIESPDDRDLNSLLARLVTSLTGGMRLVTPASEGSRNSSLKDIATNLVPYPRIHFMMPSLGGLMEKAAADFAVDSTPGTSATGHAFFKGGLSTAHVSRFEEKIAAVTILGRGLEQCALLSKVMEIKTDRRVQFVDWSPSSFLMTSYNDPIARKQNAPEVAILENSMNAKHIFARWSKELANVDDDLFGGEASLKSECLEDLAALGRDYNEVATETACAEAEEEEEE
eukprot:TRINITY_DN89830_c0_g1_i1.p1 TRINITY_DN89830_c0_g1~~TRINITY_DN89830_c0_g1_i1.p1  ORF type:complete len:663 (-),score=120.54 TRINITY_DN89830_c0_g1_i1:167-2155(-)